ncbi:uncharacterized protein LOC142233401 [Haematobia irritans]|uniref:uncharacterized protein LOC142233401 n=1 Tax=Haematobia irritans TaxID=7368 RepID=UPI003F50AA71
MDVILPYKIKNEKKYFDCAFKIGIDEMSAHKLLYITHHSDLDIFPKMGDERINTLLYFWEICEQYKSKLKDDEWELPEELETMLKIIVPWSLDVWFSKEWDRSKILWKHALIHCLNRARGLLMRLPDMMQINWDFLLLYNLTPWQVSYLKSLNVTKDKTLENGALSIETEEQIATNEDIGYLKLEQLPVIVLRLVKLFDQCSVDMVKTLCMRVIAAWNKVYTNELNQTGGSRLPYVPPEDKRCLLLICHIYLMAVYEADDVKGYVIDNMMNNIRFYNQGFQTSYGMDNLQYTPARFIALTCLHLRLQKREFFDFFIWNSFDTSPVNLFGVVSQAYKSYLLGNLLMELNNMNDDDFAANIALYKRLMNAYVNEREKSEIFMLNELKKQESQSYAHNIIQSVQNMTDFKSKICKGNRMGNIGNYENTDDIPNENDGNMQKIGIGIGDDTADEEKAIDDLRQDPIFQNIPNNEDVLYFVYEALSKKTYMGWHFAKIVLLFKIISHELNMIETWRYHPGLTTNFMLNLETKLSNHYIDLAKIFAEHPFIEQEFWLTAFYLNPTTYNYEVIKRLGIRNNRKRTDEQGRWVTGKDKIDAKYGLLSSTIDVKEITNLSNTDERKEDYDPLFQALSSLHLPTTMVKDIITVVFLARNKNFSWAVDWGELRRRCKMLMTNPGEKKRFVELNMDEANDRLKFLKIDYEKYKNRPQLDYGSIEQGYENLLNAADSDEESEESEDDDDFEDDEDAFETRKGNKKPEVIEDDNSQEDDPYLTGRRRTRARAAAAMASILFNSEMVGRRRRRKKNDDEEIPKQTEENDEEKSDDTNSAGDAGETPNIINDVNSKSSDIVKKNIKECLKQRPVLVNPTVGFQPLVDIWNVEKSDLQAIDNDCVYLLEESSSVLQRFAKLRNISKEINPMVKDEDDIIQEMNTLTKFDDDRLQSIKQERIETVDKIIKLEEYEEPKMIAQEVMSAIRLDETKINVADRLGETSNMQDCQKLKDNSNNDQQAISTAENKNQLCETKNNDNIVDCYTRSKKSNLDGENPVTENENQSSGTKDDDNMDDCSTRSEIGNVPNENRLTNLRIEEEISTEKSLSKDHYKGNELKVGDLTDIPENCDNDKNTESSIDQTLQAITFDELESKVGLKVNENKEISVNKSDIYVKKEIESELPVKHIASEELSTPLTQVTDKNAIVNSPKIGINCDMKSLESDLVSNKLHTNQLLEKVLVEENISKGHFVAEVCEDKPNEIQNTTQVETGETKVIEEKITETSGIPGRRLSADLEESSKRPAKEDSLTAQKETKGNEDELPDIHSNPQKENDLSYKERKVPENITEGEEPKSVFCSDIDSKDNKIMEISDDAQILPQQEITDSDIDDIIVYEPQKETEINTLTISGDHMRMDMKSSGCSEVNQTDHNVEILNKAVGPQPSLDRKIKNSFGGEETKSEEPLETEASFDRRDSSDIKMDEGERTSIAIEILHNPDDLLDDTKLDISDTTFSDTADELESKPRKTNKLQRTDMPLLDDGDSQSFKEPFRVKGVKVLMRKLRPSDVATLRQPKVRLKRMKNTEMYFQDMLAKRKRFNEQVYIELDESSEDNSTNSSSSDTYRPPKGSKTKSPLKRRALRNVANARTSDSDCDSTKSQLSARNRRLSTSNGSSNQSNNSTRSSSRPPKGTNLVVTPRSASGLKLRISHATRTQKQKAEESSMDEIIQLSSSSSDANTMDSLPDVIEIAETGDPLFEEEIVVQLRKPPIRKN